MMVFIDTVKVHTGDCNKVTAMANKWWDFSSRAHFNHPFVRIASN